MQYTEGMPDSYGEYIFVLIEDYQPVLALWDIFPDQPDCIKVVDMVAEKFEYVSLSKVAGYYYYE